MNKKQRFINKPWVITSIALLPILLLAGWLAYSKISSSLVTYPLGDGTKLEYIGKDNYGCVYGCDSNPGSTLFYATDMEPEEVPELFGMQFQADDISTEPQLDYQSFTLYKSEAEGIFVQYHRTGPRYAANFPHLEKSTKKHLILIDLEDYQLAKDSL